MDHTKHLWRVVLILVLAGAGAIIGRHFLIPKSFGEQGFYRYDSLGDYMTQPVRHGGDAACAACHKDRADAKAGGKHATVSCESCHAPMASHATTEAKTADMPKNRDMTLCLWCHQKLRARPETMPQIEISEHLAALDPEDAKKADVCFNCHDVHNPSMK
ncbi:MAG: hypothetical protein HZB26_14675 [Candidatus Hydrogenedentes bacterium]|nr:hypothetical protein [Candidatus Hydrogenedentota bacterium]